MLLQRFDKDLEKKYRDNVFEADLFKQRVTIVIGILFYAAFALLDYIMFHQKFIDNTQLLYFWKLRFFLAIPTFLLYLLMTYISRNSVIHGIFGVIAYSSAGVGISLMLMEVPENFSYYGGMFIVFAFGVFLLGLSLEYVTLGTVLIVAHFAFSMIDKGLFIPDGLIFSFFFVGFVIIAMYASYISEKFRRQVFMQTERLKGDKVVLERNLYDNLLDMENSHRMTIFSLARLAESRDQYTGNHIERVGSLCLKLAEAIPEDYYIKCGEDKESFVERIELASTLHDIGKVAIPENILMKPGKLTVEEMNIMKTHTLIGRDTLSEIKENYSKNTFVNMGVEICMYHHERWDGTGYPEGLNGRAIPLASRIVAIVDVYDALISERPYKKAFSHEKALRIMKEEENHFDPYLFDLFAEIMNT